MDSKKYLALSVSFFDISNIWIVIKKTTSFLPILWWWFLDLSLPSALSTGSSTSSSGKTLQQQVFTVITVLWESNYILKVVLSKNCLFPVSTMRQKREKRIAAILVVIVVVFITCNLPRVIINLYEVSKYYI